MSSKTKRERELDRQKKGGAMASLIMLFVIIILVTLLVERITVELSVSGLAIALILAIGIYCWWIRDS